MTQKTLGIIKPDAVKKKVIGRILQKVEDEGFSVIDLKMLYLTKEEAEGFYAVHKERPFFNSLTEFMSSGPIVVMALEKDNAISEWRRVMGPTDPAMAEPGSLRREFGFSIERNAVHGSDAPETAEWELNYFFKK